jgi:esterase/lipase
MIKKLSIVLASITILFVISLPLTRYQLVENVQPPNLPNSITDLDSYLSQTESQYTDLVDGAEKQIIWANNDREQTEYALVYIHGFSSTRPETAPLADLIAKEINANLFYTRLTGHGLSGKSFAAAGANDWLNDAVEAITIGKKIGKKVILIGASTGCLLVVWLSGREEYRKDIVSSILISPNFYPASKLTKMFLYPAGVEFVKLVYGKEREWKPYNEKMIKYWNHKYPWEALTPMIVLVEHIQKIKLEEIQNPSLFLYTEQDKVVDVTKIQEAFARYGAKEKKLVNLHQVKDHVMAGDIVEPESTMIVYKEILEFINSHR